MATFVFDTKWAEVLSECPAEVRLEVYEAIIRYASTGTLSDLKPLARMAFGFVRLQIDEQAERMRLEASGRPLVPISEKTGEAAKGGISEKETENEKEKETSPAPPLRKKEKDKEKERQRKEANASLSPSSKEESDPVEEAREKEFFVDWAALAGYWNERRGVMPRLTLWSERRKAAVRARMRESGGLEAVRAAIDKASESGFLQGGNQRGFVADFDWVMRPANFAKVIDGNYDSRAGAAPQALSTKRMNYQAGWNTNVKS